MARKPSAAKSTPARPARKKTAKKKAAAGKSTAKPATKPVKGSGKAPAKKTAKKPASSTARQPSAGPRQISTGRGPSPAEIGADLVALFNAGKDKEVEARYWSPEITSIEGVGVSMAWDGRKSVAAKGDAWMQDHVIHGAVAEGPFVGATGFAVRFRMDVETKSTGQRMTMDEIGVYEVRNGKIVREEFMYGG